MATLLERLRIAYTMGVDHGTLDLTGDTFQTSFDLDDDDIHTLIESAKALSAARDDADMLRIQANAVASRANAAEAAAKRAQDNYDHSSAERDAERKRADRAESDRAVWKQRNDEFTTLIAQLRADAAKAKTQDEACYAGAVLSKRALDASSAEAERCRIRAAAAEEDAADVRRVADRLDSELCEATRRIRALEGSAEPSADGFTGDLFACLVEHGCERYFVDFGFHDVLSNDVGTRAQAASVCHERRDPKAKVVRIVPADAAPPADLTARVAELEALVREGGRKLLLSAYNDFNALGAKLLRAVDGPPPPAEMGDC